MKGRHYTTAELDRMDAAAPAEPTAPAARPEGQYSTGTPGSAGAGGLKEFGIGVQTAATRPLMGLNQVLQYLKGTPEERAEANEALRLMEEEAAPALKTGLGGVGEFVGTAAPLVALPGAAVSTPLRAAATGAVTGAVQPVEPVGTDRMEFATRKAGRMLTDAALGAGASKLAKTLTREAVPIPPERQAAVKEAERLGIKVTPAQKTGEIGMAQYEEGLKSRPGSATIMSETIRQPQTKLEEAAARAIGSKGAAPTEDVLEAAGAAAAAKYEPIAGIVRMPRADKQTTLDVREFLLKQATGMSGSPQAADMAKKFLKSASGGTSGQQFLQDLQFVRDASFAARKSGDVATSEGLRDLAGVMENYVEREATTRAGKGMLSPDAFKLFKEGRADYAKIHAIEKATEPTTGRVSAAKFLSQEQKRQPAHRGRGDSPLAQGTREVGDVARVMKQLTGALPSSGTAERIAGQQLVEATTQLGSSIRVPYQMFKNKMAAKLYLAGKGPFGGGAGLLGKRLSPEQNAMVRRMTPALTVGAGEYLSQGD